MKGRGAEETKAYLEIQAGNAVQRPNNDNNVDGLELDYEKWNRCDVSGQQEALSTVFDQEFFSPELIKYTASGMYRKSYTFLTVSTTTLEQFKKL